jgi:TRAP transporter 4TM/12TM fusion protein
MRELSPKYAVAVSIISAVFAFLYLYTAGFGIFSSQTHRGFYLLFTYILCFLLYSPSAKQAKSKSPIILDAFLIGLTIISIIYWMTEYSEYAEFRVGLPNSWDTIWGLVLIFISLEVTRRVMGNTLAILGFIILAQLYFGPYLPWNFAHRGMTVTRIIEFNYSTMEGIFGTIVSVFATYVMPFVIFGIFLQKSGGGEFFIDLARALTGRVPGGPALIAVWGSAVFGSMSGSAVANVVATGSFTIPMMMRVGFKPEIAGAIEAAASTGGQFLPPIMGAGAFILAMITETPYSDVAIMAAIPALLYYFSLTSMVYFQAKKARIGGIRQEDLPKVGDVIRKGWYYASAIVAAVYLIVAGYSPPIVAFWLTIFVILCSFLRKETRLNFRKLFETLDSAGRTSLVVGSTVGTLGLVMGGITLSGLGVTFSELLLSASGGQIIITIFLVALIATIVGMGLPTAASYIVLAIIAAPALISLGVPKVYAHLLCFWLALTSNITPPVCVAAFAAASLSKADPMKTGIRACILGVFLYMVPFAFVYTPQITLLGYNLSDILSIVVTFLLATVALSASIQGWLFHILKPWERIVYFVSSILLIVPEIVTDLMGLAIFLLMAGRGYRKGKTSRQILVP